MKDSRQKFSPISIAMHWLVAFGMIGMLAYGIYLDGLPAGSDKWKHLHTHKAIGVVMLFLVSVRILWRWFNKLPCPTRKTSRWQHLAANTTHILLLIGTLLMPVSGLMMSIGGGYSVDVFGWQLIASSVHKIEWLGSLGHWIHQVLTNVLIALIALHIAAALKHQLIDKDGLISRMMGYRV